MRRKSLTCFLLILSLVFAMFAMPAQKALAVPKPAGILHISISPAGSGLIDLTNPNGTKETSGEYGFARNTASGNYGLEAVPNAGYYFVRWEATDGSHTDNPFTVYHDNRFDTEYTAVFAPVNTSLYVSVRALCNIDGAGTIKYTNNGKSVTSGSIYSQGRKSTPATFEAIPNEGYEFVEWRTASDTFYKKDAKIQVSVNYSDLGYIAVFQKIAKANKKVVVTSNNTSAGTVKLTGSGVNESGATLSVACAPGNYSIQATAKEGYKFAYWDFGDGTDTTNPFTFEHNDICDYDVKAVFEKKTITQPPTDKPVTQPPTTVPDPDPEPESDGKHMTSLFVDRLYTLVLGRDPEADGINFWTNELYNYKRTGGQVALDFFMSPEMVNRNLDNGTYVEILYATFFARSAAEDPSGYNYWVSLLNGGMSRQEVVTRFIDSQEWADTCNEFGILSGGLFKSEIAIPPTEATYDFVKRLYSTAMERTYDDEGLNYWALALSNYDMTGEQVGAFFFLSPEMEGYNLSDSEYLTRLYRTFMGRDPEPDGYNYWMGRLANGMSRTELVYGFTRSQEFVDKCIAARIVPFGDLIPAQPEAVG